MLQSFTIDLPLLNLQFNRSQLIPLLRGKRKVWFECLREIMCIFGIVILSRASSLGSVIPLEVKSTLRSFHSGSFEWLVVYFLKDDESFFWVLKMSLVCFPSRFFLNYLYFLEIRRHICLFVLFYRKGSLFIAFFAMIN